MPAAKLSRGARRSFESEDQTQRMRLATGQVPPMCRRLGQLDRRRGSLEDGC